MKPSQLSQRPLLLFGTLIAAFVIERRQHRAMATFELPSPPTARNAGLHYRPIGSSGEPYPDWLRALKGKSGVYIIRDGATILYVGESHTNRLYQTLTRHFQTWRRWNTHWKNQYTQGHDPGLTYPRDRVTVAVCITTSATALDQEARLIARLRPRDNLLGQPEDEAVPF
jgi:hypothetical protein